MKSNYPNKIKLGVALIILFALLSNARLLKKEYKFDPKLIGRDSISLYEKRFEGLREILPPRGIVGYISDSQVVKGIINADAGAKYNLTQAALVPVIVTNSIERELVVGNFHGPISNSIFPKDKEFIVLRNFGNGVILFKTKVK